MLAQTLGVFVTTAVIYANYRSAIDEFDSAHLSLSTTYICGLCHRDIPLLLDLHANEAT